MRAPQTCAAARRRAVLRTGFALALAPLAARSPACEFESRTLRIVRPWARASVPGATAARVSMTFEDVLEDDRLVRVMTPVAGRAALGGPAASDVVDLPIPQGRVTALSEHGTHLLLLDLRQPLEVGREYPLILVFAHGGGVNADFHIAYA